MKQRFLVICIFLINIGFAQTKQQLITSIIKVNSVHSDCVGMACRETEQYRNFQKLKSLLSDSELTELTENKNPVIRTYASLEVIKSEKGNIQKLLLNELNLNQYVETFDGCVIDYQPVSSIIYHEYWNKIRRNALNDNVNESERDIVMKKALEADIIMKKLDSLVVFNEKEVYWLLYDRCFENRVYDESYFNRIETLSFKENNSYAFEYLKRSHSEIYNNKLFYYLENQFASANFKTENEIFYFHSFIELLLEEKNNKYNQIVINKLRKDKNWKKEASWFSNTLSKYNIKI